jgi:hypothetical protein
METITAAIVHRVRSEKFGLTDPCVICGEQMNLPSHQHNTDDTDEMIRAVDNLSVPDLLRILAGK